MRGMRVGMGRGGWDVPSLGGAVRMEDGETYTNIPSSIHY